MKKLNFYLTEEIHELAWPEEEKNFSMATPAILFLTDFTRVRPLIIEASVSAIEAKNYMRTTHVRLKLVVDENKKFIGVVSADDLIDRRLVQKISEGHERETLSVTQFMTPRKDLKAFDIKELSTASIGDVIDALKDSGQQHCLVIDRDHNLIRGIFSASDISRKLHLPIDIQDKSSFLRVFAAVS